MDDDLAAFLAPLTAFAEEEVEWGRHRFHLTDYLTGAEPPLPCVTSSRAVLVDGADMPGSEPLPIAQVRQRELDAAAAALSA